jgi:hypothetical protein
MPKKLQSLMARKLRPEPMDMSMIESTDSVPKTQVISATQHKSDPEVEVEQVGPHID